MLRPIPIFLLSTALLCACAAPEKTVKQQVKTVEQQVKTVEQVAAEHPRLTGAQVQKYLNSYLSVHDMASAYWGERKYSPPNKMLPPQGTFNRAVEEMRASGKLPDFEILLQSHGFESFAAWERTGQRISAAYVALRNEIRHPDRAAGRGQRRDKQLAAIDERRAKLQAKADKESLEQLKYLDMAQKQVERIMLMEADAEVLRPYFRKFEKMNQQIAARKR